MSRRLRIALIAVVCAFAVHGQTNTPVNSPAAAAGQSAPVVSEPAPGEIYKQSMRPLEQVRASLDNWSDAELGALAVGMKKAKEACAQMRPDSYSGDNLYDLAHLCAFGQDWSSANAAATRYIASHAEPHRAQAYALSVNALMHMGETEKAVQTTREMLNTLPYDAEVAFTLRYMKDALEQAGGYEQLGLAEDEHEKIMAALQQGTVLKAATGDAVITAGELYDSAMLLAFYYTQSMSNRIAGAAIAGSCDKALPGTATSDDEDRQRIENTRTRFHLLGGQLPGLTVTRAFLSPAAKPQLPRAFGAGTVLVLFPGSCVQCRKMMKTLTQFAKVNAATPLYAYGLVFPDTSIITDKAAHDAWLAELQGTSTFLVPAETQQAFGAQEFPLAVVIDGSGTVRFIGSIPTNAFDGNGYIEKVIVQMTTSHRTVPKASAKQN